MIDKQKVGNFALEAMDSIAGNFEGVESTVGDMMLIVEVRANLDSGGMGSHVMCYSSDDRPHAQMGLLEGAELAVKDKVEGQEY